MEENQNDTKIRSLNNLQPIFVRFVNRTHRNVNLYWIDYQGRAISYGILSPEQYKDINTFATHPWIFVDNETGQRFVVDHKDVFYPKLDVCGCREACQHQVSRMFVFIRSTLYSLQDLALRAVVRCLKYSVNAFCLELPRHLQYEIAQLLPNKNEC